MFDRYPKSFLIKAQDSFVELLSGDKRLGPCGLCSFLSKETNKTSMSYDFVDDFMTFYNIRHIPNYGRMSPERIILTRKIVEEINNYLEKEC